MRFRWTLSGREITTVELGNASTLADLVEELLDEDTPLLDDDPSIAGGQSHNFERDTNPADPDDRYRWDEEFGFNK